MTQTKIEHPIHKYLHPSTIHELVEDRFNQYVSTQEEGKQAYPDRLTLTVGGWMNEMGVKIKETRYEMLVGRIYMYCPCHYDVEALVENILKKIPSNYEFYTKFERSGKRFVLFNAGEAKGLGQNEIDLLNPTETDIVEALYDWWHKYQEQHDPYEDLYVI